MCKRKNKTKIREVGKYEGMQNEKILKERKRERERTFFKTFSYFCKIFKLI